MNDHDAKNEAHIAAFFPDAHADDVRDFPEPWTASLARLVMCAEPVAGENAYAYKSIIATRIAELERERDAALLVVGVKPAYNALMDAYHELATLRARLASAEAVHLDLSEAIEDITDAYYRGGIDSHPNYNDAAQEGFKTLAAYQAERAEHEEAE